MVRREDNPAGRYRDEEDFDWRSRRRGREARKAEKKRAPLMLRLLSWLGVILFCFVAGYLGTSWMMGFLNTRFLQKDNRVENRQELEAFTEKERSRPVPVSSGQKLDVQQLSLKLYHLKNGGLAEETRRFVSHAQEDNIRDAVHAVLVLSGIETAENGVRVLHVFRGADTVFLDLSGAFAQALAKLGQRNSQFLITGIVRTMQDNFPPIVKVRFLIDGAVASAGAPVDLTVPWQLPCS